MKTLATGTLFLVFAVVAGVVGVVVWLLWEVGGRMLSAVDALGPGLFEAGALVTFGVFVFVVVGGAVAIVRWMNLRSRAVHPGATGLYPLQYHGPALRVSTLYSVNRRQWRRSPRQWRRRSHLRTW